MDDARHGKRLQVYTAPGITVSFDPDLCVHSGVCLMGLPAVFDVRRRRWIRPQARGSRHGRGAGRTLPLGGAAVPPRSGGRGLLRRLRLAAVMVALGGAALAVALGAEVVAWKRPGADGWRGVRAAARRRRLADDPHGRRRPLRGASGRSLLFARDTQDPDSGELFVWYEHGREAWPPDCPAGAADEP